MGSSHGALLNRNPRCTGNKIGVDGRNHGRPCMWSGFKQRAQDLYSHYCGAMNLSRGRDRSFFACPLIKYSCSTRFLAELIAMKEFRLFSFFSFFIILVDTFCFSAQLVGGFSLHGLLDNPIFSQLPSLLPPPRYVLASITIVNIEYACV